MRFFSRIYEPSVKSISNFEEKQEHHEEFDTPFIMSNRRVKEKGQNNIDFSTFETQPRVEDVSNSMNEIVRFSLSF